MRMPITLVLGVVIVLLTASCGKDATAAGSAADICPPPTPVPIAAPAGFGNSPGLRAMLDRGHVVVGVKADQPTLGYKTAGNERCGFDIDIARLISAGLGFPDETIEYREIPSSNREAAIRAGEIDYYVGSYSINDKRKQQVAFAGPYLDTGQALLVRIDDTEVRDRFSLRGKKVCSTTGTTSIQLIKDEQLTQPENIAELKTGAECLSQMVDGSVDVLTTDGAILQGYAAAVPGRFRVIGPPFSIERYGVGLRKGDPALRSAMNDILRRAAADGTWQRLYDATLGKSGVSASPPAIEP